MGAIIAWIRGGGTRIEMKTVDLKSIENVSILNYIFSYDPEQTTWEHEEREFIKKNPYFTEQNYGKKGGQKKLNKKDDSKKTGKGQTHLGDAKHESTKEKKKKNELKAHEDNIKNLKIEKQALEEEYQKLVEDCENHKKQQQYYMEMLKELENKYNESIQFDFLFTKNDSLRPINITQPKSLQKTTKIN